jgi:hypothetical protein
MITAIYPPHPNTHTHTEWRRKESFEFALALLCQKRLKTLDISLKKKRFLTSRYILYMLFTSPLGFLSCPLLSYILYRPLNLYKQKVTHLLPMLLFDFSSRGFSFFLFWLVFLFCLGLGKNQLGKVEHVCGVCQITRNKRK